MNYPDRAERREIRQVPLWVALRWGIVCVFCGPERAERFIRPEDRSRKTGPQDAVEQGNRT